MTVAGLPHLHYDALVARRPHTIVGDRANIVSAPLSGQIYTHAYINRLIKKLWDRCSEEPAEHISLIGIYATDFQPESRDRLLAAFSPFALMVPLNREHRGDGPRQTERKHAATVVERIRTIAMKARKLVDTLSHETLSNSNRTPFLLPLRNFQSNFLGSWIDQAQATMSGDGADPDVIVDRLRDEFERKHPSRRALDDGKRYFVDDRSLVFKSAGRALHGLPRHRWGDAHEPRCLLNAKSRLGAPFPGRFHYDCQCANSTVSRDFTNCHGVTESVRNASHVNVSPNDHWRV